MSSKQQRAVKGKEPKVSRNEGWNALSWDDLTEWAGSRSVERGRDYQRQGRVHDLAISEDGWLLATAATTRFLQCANRKLAFPAAMNGWSNG